MTSRSERDPNICRCGALALASDEVRTHDGHSRASCEPRKAGAVPVDTASHGARTPPPSWAASCVEDSTDKPRAAPPRPSPAVLKDTQAPEGRDEHRLVCSCGSAVNENGVCLAWKREYAAGAPAVPTPSQEDTDNTGRAAIAASTHPPCAPCACGKMTIPNPTAGVMDFASVVHRHDACVYAGNPSEPRTCELQHGCDGIAVGTVRAAGQDYAVCVFHLKELQGGGWADRVTLFGPQAPSASAVPAMQIAAPPSIPASPVPAPSGSAEAHHAYVNACNAPGLEAAVAYIAAYGDAAYARGLADAEGPIEEQRIVWISAGHPEWALCATICKERIRALAGTGAQALSEEKSK